MPQRTSQLHYCTSVAALACDEAERRFDKADLLDQPARAIHNRCITPNPAPAPQSSPAAIPAYHNFNLRPVGIGIEGCLTGCGCQPLQAVACSPLTRCWESRMVFSVTQ